MDSQKPKSIALAVTAVLFLALGAGAGAIWMNRYKDQVEADRQEREEEERKKKENTATPPPNFMPAIPGGPMGAGPPGGGGGGPGGTAPPMMMGGGGRGPSAKMQLASLVNKLDILTTKPLTVNLNSQQRAKLAEQINGLLDKDEISDTDAKKRLDAVLEIVKADKETLEAAGYRWPGQQGGGGGMGGGQPPKNPFKDDANGKHLKSFQDLLLKPGAN